MSPDWLAQLAPAHAPPPVSWWPPAPGWWAASACLLALLALLARWLLRRVRRPRRKALAELRLIRHSDGDGPAVARAVQSLMRRYAIAVFGREQVARLAGAAWLEFIVSQGGTALAGPPGRSLLIAAFGNHAEDDREHWLSAAEGFIRGAARRHKGRGS